MDHHPFLRVWRNGRRGRFRFCCLRRMSSSLFTRTNLYAVVAQLVECHLAKVDVASPNLVYRSICRCNSMVEFQPSKLATWVRFPSPAPYAPLAQLVECHLAKVDVAGPSPVYRSTCGCSSMVELQPSKLVTWVRFPSPALFYALPAPVTRRSMCAGKSKRQMVGVQIGAPHPTT